MLPPRAPITPPTLHTPRLILRALTESDRQAFLTMLSASHEHFARYAPPPPNAQVPAEQFNQALAKAADVHPAGTGLRLAIFLRDNATLVGQAALSDIIRGLSQRCSLGYSIHAHHTRQGYATEALTALLAHAFSPTPPGLNLHRVECAVQPTNTPSLALATKLGFKQEGFAPRYLFIGNDWQDHVLLALTND